MRDLYTSLKRPPGRMDIEEEAKVLQAGNEQRDYEKEIAAKRRELADVERGMRNLLDLAQYNIATEEIRERLDGLGREKKRIIGEIQGIESAVMSRTIDAEAMRYEYAMLAEALKKWHNVPSETMKLLRPLLKITCNVKRNRYVMSMEPSYGRRYEIVFRIV